MTTKDNWSNWNNEQHNFAHRDTEGFTKDLAALKAHISKLQEVCPKDKAGWPVGTALNVLDKLRKEHDRFQRYLDQLR